MHAVGFRQSSLGKSACREEHAPVGDDELTPTTPAEPGEPGLAEETIASYLRRLAERTAAPRPGAAWGCEV